MPNGRRDWAETELPRLEAFFAPIAGLLEAFADRHGLKLDRYWHQFPVWRLDFRHPKGGVAGILIEKEGTSVGIHVVWWLDVFDEQNRYTRRADVALVGPGAELVRPHLTKALGTLLAWDSGSWDSVRHCPEWKNFTAESFERAGVDQYPRPR